MHTGSKMKITEWMTDQTIFITGVSGYIGKVLLWKLLKSSPHLKAVYVLLRSKKGKTMEERLNDILSATIFEEFKKENPETLAKVKGIEGDLIKTRLGLQDSDWILLENEVTTVFHVAASVRFDDTLQKAIFINTRSTKYALLLAKGIKSLKAFVYVSTAYTNCHNLHIPEKVIPTDFNPEKMIAVAEKFGEHELEILSPNLLKEYPNTYIFTKKLAEDLVSRSSHGVPVAIVRPSIVISSLKEPKPGWCDSMSGFYALMGAGGKGVLRVNYAYSDSLLDLTTVDVCVNAIIVAAWYRDVCFPVVEKKNFVFNVTELKLSIGDLIKRFDELLYVYPFRNQLWKAFSAFTVNSILFHVLTFLLHIVPGVIVDGVLKINGRKPVLMQVYRKLYAVSINLKPFVSSVFHFDTNNFKLLGELVPDVEKKIFFTNSSIKSMNDKYFIDALLGIRAVMGDPPNIYKEDVTHTHRLYWIDLIFRLILLGLFIWILPLKPLYEYSTYKMKQFQNYVIEG